MLKILSVLSKDNLSLSLPLSCIIVTGSAALLFAWRMTKIRLKSLRSLQHGVVVITGCDSGLGYSAALHCYEAGFHVFAGVLNSSSAGAESLKTLKSEIGNLDVIQLDVTNFDDIKKTLEIVKTFLDNNPQYYLHGIINNSGVMIFGEFEWQTNEMIFQQINVNLLSAMHLTKEFLPQLRKDRGRIINVGSHCAYAALPGLSVYAASKSGLKAWNDAIRVEYAKYGIKVIFFIPGSFFNQSNIFSKQLDYSKKMKNAMTEESIEFYGDYFDQYQLYLSAISGEKPLQRLENRKVYQNLTDALVSESPRPSYCVSPLRYGVYHLLFRITPTNIRDYLVEKFVQMPTYKK